MILLYPLFFAAPRPIFTGEFFSHEEGPAAIFLQLEDFEAPGGHVQRISCARTAAHTRTCPSAGVG